MHDVCHVNQGNSLSGMMYVIRFQNYPDVICRLNQEKNMKNTYVYFWAFILVFTGSRQLQAQIPNPDFEVWDSFTLNQPEGYRVYGATTRVPGYMSNSAVRLQRDLTLSEGPGAIVYGNPENNFSGGIPVQARPDSAVAFFRYHLPAGDSAWFLVFLKREGQFISQDIFRFGGSDSAAFNRLAYAINYSDTGQADSLVIGVASTNPDEDYEGGFVVVDSIHFTGGTGSINVPNGNFEDWITIGFNNPRGWTSTNNQGRGIGFTVQRTRDHAFWQQACRIENLPAGNGEFIPGYIMAGRQGNDGPRPGFAVNGRDSVLYFSYKSFPAGDDTINIAILMFRQGNMIGMGNFRQPFTISSWSQTAIPIDYWSSDVPDSAVIFCAAFLGGSEAKGNSILYVDGFSLNKPFTNIRNKWKLPALVYPNPATGHLYIRHHEIPAQPVVELSGMNGQTVRLQGEILQEGSLLRIDLSGLASGIWIWKMDSEDGILSGKIRIGG